MKNDIFVLLPRKYIIITYVHKFLSKIIRHFCALIFIMDSDIDIEEHDLLENPVIKNIFPDLSILKKEISGYFEEASDIKKEPEYNDQFLNKNKDTVTDINNLYAGQIEDPQNITQEIDKAQMSVLGNKIILGSKPTQPALLKRNNGESQDRIYAAKIFLNDIKSYLTRSERYCKICLTMFPQKKIFEIHNKTVHEKNRTYGTHGNTMKRKNKITIGSIVKKYKCNECNESFSQHSLLRRHSINIHRKSFINSSQNSLQQTLPLSTKMVKSSKLNQCFHCKVSFSSNKLLIEHIYKVLQSKKGTNNSVNNPSLIDTQCEVEKQIKTNVKISQVITKKRVRGIDFNHYQTKRTNSNVKKKCVPISRKQKVPTQTAVKKIQINTSLFQCVYCSYIFTFKKFCLNHLINKHKDSSITEVKEVIFNEQCKYCSKKNYNWKLHNKHMRKCHKHKIDKTVKINPEIRLTRVDYIMAKKKAVKHPALKDSNVVKLINKQMRVPYNDSLDNERHNEINKSYSIRNDQLLLKSILFKCRRCDIHFLSAKSAMNHAVHMELLINWKCLSCNKIFKKVDENLHLKQHLFTDDFNVLELTEPQLARILYKCSKCAILFDANSYLPHLDNCEMAVAKSVYCKVCDILVDKCIGDSHKSSHTKAALKPTDFTIVCSDVIRAEPIKNNAVKPVIKKNIKKKVYDIKYCFDISYCKTCNSFISKKGRNVIVHMEERCAHLPTYVCQICGLIFTNKTMGTHRLMHKERKGIRLQNFSFYTFGNKKILPPIPKYPKCKSCHVHFISKYAVINHLCSEDFLTCHICNIKLSEPVFKLHMAFHYYSKTSDKKDLDQIDRIDLPKISERLEETRHPSRLPPRNREIPISNQSMELNFCEIKPHGVVNEESSEKRQSVEMKCENVDNFLKDGTKPDLGAVSDELKRISQTRSINTVLTHNTNQMHSKSNYALFNVLYCCLNCHTTIDSYDAVVEHCQEHLCGVELKKIVCETCKLTVDSKSYENHMEFHTLKATNRPVEIIKFDTFYFIASSSIWIRHIFQNVDDEKKTLILNKSIYKYGHKIKMQVIQEGPSDLTIYKCNSCFIIVDPDSLSKHVENSCFKTRKHPCSYCGLPFMSYISLKQHSNIHKKMNISLKSYRIVIINQEKDKKINKVLNGSNKCFLLYMCRNCKGVFDTYQRVSHTLCNDKDLKQCSVCDLLFYCSDYKAHMRKHELVCNFVPKNMKIVLFGQMKKIDENQINSSIFEGTIMDFTYIQCVKCRVCLEKSSILTLIHNTCYEDSLISKCAKCNLYILRSKFARHNKLHDINVHFTKENINIIPYDHSEKLSKLIPANLDAQDSNRTKSTTTLQNDKIIECHNSTKSLNQMTNLTTDTSDMNLMISEKTAKLFKCSCGLHFLDKTGIYEHLDHCNSEKSKQNCSKCNLLFTPSVLFTHLLQHHGDKKYIYKFNIIEMSKKRNHIVTLYHCVNCKTHFLDHDKTKEHYENCKESGDDRTECTKCKLYFNSSIISQHKTLHHDDKVADFEIIDVTTTNIHETDQNKTDSRSLDSVIKQADLVRESKYIISNENLSQIDLSRYSNTIFECKKCNTHFLTEKTFKLHVASGKHVLPQQGSCRFCKLRFSGQSLAKHIYIHHTQMKLINNFIIKSNV